MNCWIVHCKSMHTWQRNAWCNPYWMWVGKRVAIVYEGGPWMRVLYVIIWKNYWKKFDRQKDRGWKRGPVKERTSAVNLCPLQQHFRLQRFVFMAKLLWFDSVFYLSRRLGSSGTSGIFVYRKWMLDPTFPIPLPILIGSLFNSVSFSNNKVENFPVDVKSYFYLPHWNCLNQTKTKTSMNRRIRWKSCTDWKVIFYIFREI